MFISRKRRNYGAPLNQALIQQHLADAPKPGELSEDFPSFIDIMFAAQRQERDEPGAKVWKPHTTSLGLRPASKSTASFRGATTDTSFVEQVFHSNLERDHVHSLMADPRVAQVSSQTLRVRYVDALGKVRHTTIDLLVTLTDGRKIAIAVKPHGRRLRSGIDSTMRYAAESNPKVADRFVVSTDRHVTKVQADNARLILRSRRLRAEQDVELMRVLLPTINGAVPIWHLVRQFQQEGRGLTAAVNLIDEGLLTFDATKPLSYSTLITRNLSK